MGRRNQVTPSGDRVWRVALYIRLSREDGNEVSNSVTHQKERLLAYLSGFEDEHELAGIYIDDGCTGTDTDRDGFQRMLAHIRERRINCVIVKDLSRLSRNVADATYHMESFFIEYGVRFISLELPMLDSYKYPEQMNSILVPIQNVINDDFCRQTSVKVRSVFNQKRRQGQFIGAFAPYGYRKDPEDGHRLLVDDEAARVVRDIFMWYVKDGMSKAGIARRLNEWGIPNPTAYKKRKGLRYANPHADADTVLWGPKTVRGILRNAVYAGHMVQGRHRVRSYKVHKQIATPAEEWFVVEGMHTPVVEREVFDMAQRLQEKDARTAPGSHTVNALSGFVRCPDCGKAMVRSQGGGRTKAAYYQCRTFREQSKTACGKHSIRADVLEDALASAIRAISLLPSVQEVVGEVSRGLCGRNDAGRLAALQTAREKELANTTAIKDTLYADWKNGDITKDDYHRLKARYEKKADTLAANIAALLAERAKTENPTHVSSQVFPPEGAPLDRGLMAAFVDTIFVQENGGVEIVFNFRDPYKRFSNRNGSVAPVGPEDVTLGINADDANPMQ